VEAVLLRLNSKPQPEARNVAACLVPSWSIHWGCGLRGVLGDRGLLPFLCAFGSLCQRGLVAFYPTPSQPQDATTAIAPTLLSGYPVWCCFGFRHRTPV
jgi:hypothetical protein